VKEYLGTDETFLANYSDGLTDLPLDEIVRQHHDMGVVATFMAYKSNQSFHVVKLAESNMVSSINPIAHSGMLINCGYFVLNSKIFDYIQPGDELVEKPFQRLISENQLSAYPFNGFWAAMDTFKDKQILDDMHSSGNKPWEVWKTQE
jgi:glucose-1-phosphate cytidylyltransferase